ncbi:hypothetical protein Vsou_20010 [Vulcanisaeta souniana JCM 11219]|nr:hypothetical protein Vsou_20010 [Vulcanisaeta souniana JCM 11219]
MSNGGVVDASKLVAHVTIAGRLVPEASDDFMKLARLAHDFRKAVLYATRMIARGVDANSILRELRSMLNKAYGDSAYKVAKALVEGCRYSNGNLRHIKVKKLFIVSEGEATRLGNRNVRLGPLGVVKIKYPYDGSWLSFKALFGEEYIPLVKELVELSRQKRMSYGARIVFRSGRIYLHISIPLELYLKHFKRGEARGSLVVGFDLNSDRINMVIVDKYGRIRDTRAAWFPEVTSHGFPRNKARARRLEALSELLRYAYYHGVGVVVFENLLLIKRRRFGKNRVANRKIARFAKRELLMHGIIMAMKYGFRVYLVSPRGTSKSREHDEVMKRLGLDRHMASAYLIAMKGLK